MHSSILFTVTLCLLCSLLCIYNYVVPCRNSTMCRVTNLVPSNSRYNISSELEIPLCDYIDVDHLDEVRPNKNDLSIMQLNIRGSLNKQGRLSELINKTQTDIVLLCETWLNKETENLVALDNHKLFSNHRKDRLGGGVGILINKNL